MQEYLCYFIVFCACMCSCCSVVQTHPSSAFTCLTGSEFYTTDSSVFPQHYYSIGQYTMFVLSEFKIAVSCNAVYTSVSVYVCIMSTLLSDLKCTLFSNMHYHECLPRIFIVLFRRSMALNNNSFCYLINTLFNTNLKFTTTTTYIL